MYYSVSNMGNIRSERLNKLLKPGKNNRGYSTIVFKRTLERGKSLRVNFTVHRLVALAFIPNLNSNLYINHINSIRTDNTVKNLEWCTASENMLHSWGNLGLRKSKKT